MVYYFIFVLNMAKRVTKKVTFSRYLRILFCLLLADYVMIFNYITTYKPKLNFFYITELQIKDLYWMNLLFLKNK